MLDRYSWSAGNCKNVIGDSANKRWSCFDIEHIRAPAKQSLKIWAKLASIRSPELSTAKTIQCMQYIYIDNPIFRITPSCSINQTQKEKQTCSMRGGHILLYSKFKSYPPVKFSCMLGLVYIVQMLFIRGLFATQRWVHCLMNLQFFPWRPDNAY